ncbi:hypothetical protein DAEQUDRAFT_746563 [Daedalea quercina L-15889]|uniref:Acyl-CoA dehydrogenase NM domain-like protein n=1 Tax=Daedalea quercina L-15889 TaxID=1314783 RepID=A0A165N379_9APHY|nr:hypothetical protein DAEQUDRAFT_746563 [Daedalea quercina L-15889]
MPRFWHPTFDLRTELLSPQQRILLSYKRAQAVLQASALTFRDVQALTPAFVSMHKHPILALDVGCANILACHVNLFLGTLAQSVLRRPDLLPLFRQALRGEVIGNFLLTEVGHGLDIMGLETEAVKLDDGFILRTPTDSACKFMPPTTSHPDISKVAIVFARLLIEDVDHGVHPFLVPTSDAGRMRPGISAVLLPPRSGACPLDYALTSFNNIKLPSSALLGNIDLLQDHHAALKKYVQRIVVGQMCVPFVAVTGLKMAACIGVHYSLRRHVRGRKGNVIPIMSFRTQQLPMLYALATAYVLDVWADEAAQALRRINVEDAVLEGMAVVFKTTVCRLALRSYREVAERLGAQGTFGHNFVAQIEMDIRGLVIAEGDVTTTAIRLYSELLQRKYTLPACVHGDTILARHARGIHDQCMHILHSLPGGHRDPEFNDLLLPQCERGVLALGCSYAYSKALDSGVASPLLDLFECAAIRLDAAWYAENENIGEKQRLLRENKAVHAALSHTREYVDGLHITEAISAPIMHEATWNLECAIRCIETSAFAE